MGDRKRRTSEAAKTHASRAGNPSIIVLREFRAPDPDGIAAIRGARP